MENRQTIFQTVKNISFCVLLIYWCYCFWAVFKIAGWVAAFATNYSYNITSVIIQTMIILLACSQIIWVKLSGKKPKLISSAGFTVVFQIICGLAVAVLIMME